MMFSVERKHIIHCLKISIVISSIIISISALNSQATDESRLEEEWFITWGGEEYESPRRIIVDGENIYVVGRTTSFHESSNIFLLKYDLNGELQWESIWNYPHNNETAESFTLDEEAIYVTGNTWKDRNTYSLDILTIKYDKKGQILWNTSWGGIAWEGRPSTDIPSDIELLDDYIYVLGTTTHNSSLIPWFDNRISEQDILLQKYDSHGELIWKKQYGGDHTFEYGTCLETRDGKMYIAGSFLTLPSDGTRENKLYLISLNAEGNILWDRTYDELSSDWIMGAWDLLVFDGNLFVMGSITWENEGYRVFVSMMNLEGELQWRHVFEEEYLGVSFGMEVIGDHLLVMSDAYVTPEDSDIIIYDFDLEGNLTRDYAWGTEKNESAWDMQVSGDSIYLMEMISPSQDWVDVFLSSVKNPYSGEVDIPDRNEPDYSLGLYGIVGFLALSFLYVVVERFRAGRAME